MLLVRTVAHITSPPRVQHSILPAASLLLPYLLSLLLSSRPPLMQQQARVLHSVDHVRLIPAYLCVNELMQAAALSRSIRTAFDSDAVWYRRFMDVCSIMRLYVEMPVPAAAVLSAAQLAALPPLPSLAEAAALCEQAYRESELCKETPSHLQPPCVAAIVHLPCTLLYHARIVGRCIADQHVLKQFAEHIEFTLTYSQQLLRWTVQEVGESGSGRRALCVDNNVDACRTRSDSVDRPPAAPTIGSYKQRYIHILTCRSDRQCYHLLPPSPPIRYQVGVELKVRLSLNLDTLCAAVALLQYAAHQPGSDDSECRYDDCSRAVGKAVGSISPVNGCVSVYQCRL